MTCPRNDRFLRALRREHVDRTPVWMMRQAGRYLPEYRKTRAQAGDFMSLCRNAALACEVTMQPLRRYPFDAAILFSDILTIPDAMGLGLHFKEGEGPHFTRPVRTATDIARLQKPDISRDLGYVLEAVDTIRTALRDEVPLIGFSGSPWTLACYMIEGSGSRDFARVRAMLYREPETLHALLELMAESVAEYLSGQINAGAQVVQIFDTWGGLLSTPAYQSFSLHYMQQIIRHIRTAAAPGAAVPVILFTKQGGQWLTDMAEAGPDALGLDWTTSMAVARQQTGGLVALQGNMDPAVLLATPAAIRREVQRILQEYGTGPGHVFNLGHGITPQVDPENVRIFVEAVQELSPQYHRA